MATLPGRMLFDQVLSGGRGISTRDYMSGYAGMRAPETQSAPARDTSLSPVGAGSSAGNLDVYGSPGTARRDLKMDPLSAGELQGLKYAQLAVSAMPFGAIANQAIDYNLGKNYDPGSSTEIGGLSHRDSLGYRVGLAESQGMPTADAAMWAAKSAATDAGTGISNFFGGTPVPVEDRSTYSPAAIQQAQSGYDPAGYQSNFMRNLSMDTSTQEGQAAAAESQAQAASAAAAQAATAPAYTGSSSGGYNQLWGGLDTSPEAASNGGYGVYADGGMVGLTGPMMNQAAPNLAQMGFADGGGVGMGAPGGSMGPEQLRAQINQMVRNPQFKQVAQRAVGGAMASGELTPEELVTLGRIAEAAMHKPDLYPQLRQFAVANGMTPLPPSYDPRLITVLIAAAKIMGATPPGQVPPTDQAQMQNPNGQPNGGFLQGPGTGRSDSIGTVEETTGKPVKVANGEYVVPAHVVAAKGKDFFDKMLRQYAQLTPQE